MGRYNPEKFNFSNMSERVTFFTQGIDGSYTESLKCWAHFFKDGFTRSEDENFYKIMVREQKALEPILSRTTKVKWKKMDFLVFSWRDPSFESRGFIEIIIKQIPGEELDNDGNIVGDGYLFKDVVDIYRVIKTSKTSYGIETFEFKYDFTKPIYTGVKCSFSTDRNRYLDDKRTDTEHDSFIVKFNSGVDILEEDYIDSPFHGRFKVDMVSRTEDNFCEAYVQRREVQ